MNVRQLVKEGRWLVPPAERPTGWESWPLPVTVTNAGVPDILRCRCGRGLHHVGQCFYRTLRTRTARLRYRQEFQTEIVPAISASANDFGADAELEMAARILFAGIYNYRSVRDICRFTDASPIFAQRIIDNCLKLGLWLPDGRVVLGEPGDCDMEFWLLSMAANGEIQYHHTSRTFQALPHSRSKVARG